MRTIKFSSMLFLFLLALNAYGQRFNTEQEILKDANLSRREYKKAFTKYDFGSLWTQTENSSVFGFIGQDFRRLRVKIISAVKDKKRPGTYLVSGKSMIRNNVCAFGGTIKIDSVKTYKKMHFGVDDEYKNKGIKRQGVLLAKYDFAENGCKFAGRFAGRLTTKFYLDKNYQPRYDNIEIESDGYGNNQFVGTWKSYRGAITKTANWGDHRIPFSGDLDGGAGEFSPIDKYLQFGWQNYRDAYTGNNQQARTAEKKIWWK